MGWQLFDTKEYFFQRSHTKFYHEDTLGNPKMYTKANKYKHTQPAIACSKLTIETLEQGVKYVQS